MHKWLTHPNIINLHLTHITDLHQHAKAFRSRLRVTGKIQDCAGEVAVSGGAEPQSDVAWIEDNAASRVTTRESERSSAAASGARAARWEEGGGGCVLQACRPRPAGAALLALAHLAPRQRPERRAAPASRTLPAGRRRRRIRCSTSALAAAAAAVAAALQTAHRRSLLQSPEPPRSRPAPWTWAHPLPASPSLPLSLSLSPSLPRVRPS